MDQDEQKTFEKIDEFDEVDGDEIIRLAIDLVDRESPESNNDDTFPHASEDDTEDLPVATEILMGQEVVIDGVVVDEREKKKNPKLFLAALIASFLAVTIVIIEVSKKEPSFASENPSMAPTYFYQDYVKQLLIPISGEEALNDPTSIQYGSWLFVCVTDDPVVVDESTINVNDTERIIRQYILLVVTLSALSGAFDVQSLATADGFPHECDVFTCNENDEVTIMVLSNLKTGAQAGGTIAKEIGELQELTHLVFARNAMQGTIPTEIGKLKNLQVLDIQQNNFVGTIPTQIGMLENLDWMVLRENMLENSIPSEIGSLENISYIDLSKNFLTGTVPSEMVSLREMKGLNLHHNELTGEIEFLCHKNYTNEKFSETSLVGLTLLIDRFHTFSGTYGLVVDCIEEEPILKCSCCICA